MKIEVADIGPCKKKLHVEVPPEEVSEKMQQRFEELRTTVALPGFRRGRAPLRLVRRRFAEQVTNETKVGLIAESYKQAIDENQLKPLAEPDLKPDEIKMEEDEAFVFDAEVEVAPSFELPEYKGIKVVKRAIEVTDAEAEELMEDLRRRGAQQVPVEEGVAAEEGHVLIASIRFSAGDEELLKQENVPFKLTGNSIGPIRVPELVETLKGVKPGDERQLPAGFPDDFRDENLRGKQGILRVEVNEIKREELPDVNDEWAKTWGADTIQALKENARADIARMKEQDSQKDIDRQIMERLLSGAEFELPQGVVEERAKRRAASVRFQLLYQGVPADEVQKRTEEIEKGSREAIERDLRAEFFFEEIAGKEDLQPTENEVEAWVRGIAERRGVAPNRYRRELEQKGELELLKQRILESKVLQFLRDNAEIVEEGAEEKTAAEEKEAAVPEEKDEEKEEEKDEEKEE